MIRRKRILVAPEAEFDAHRPLFQLLAKLYPAEFAAASLESAAAGDGAIVWADSVASTRRVMGWDTSALVIAPPREPRFPVTRGRVRFGTTVWLERCFRNQAMHEAGVREFAALLMTDGDYPLCYLDGQPYWSSRERGTTRVSTVALGPPFITEAHTVYHHFNRLTWLQLLPFLDFVKRLTADGDWSPPPLRACLMFDDPNLHWDTYGHIDFRVLADHAEACNYHAAFAMIPADAWYVHPRTAQLFRDLPTRMSLLIHGNDHTPAEFGNYALPDERTRSLAQALRRIENFERQSGLAVSRVMAPPHGAFRIEVGDAMLRLGYDAICVSRASLKSWNKDHLWPSSFGHNMVELLGDGFPAIPRQAIGLGQEEGYRLAAFLNQPIIPHGHHDDCADGLGLLTRVADVINSLGAVNWVDMSTLSRTNYQTRRAGDTLFVRMLSRHVTLPALDPEIRLIVAERPWIAETAPIRDTLVCRQAERICYAARAARESAGISVAPHGAISLHSPSHHAIDPLLVEPGRRRVWPVIRRLLSEARDRVAPLTPGRPQRAA